MAELRTEEEQLDAIKRWWKENGTSLIVGAVLAAAGVFGWNAWQDHKHNTSVAASADYQQLLGLASQQQLDDSARSQAQELVNNLSSEHDDTLYADLALLLDARLKVDADDLDGASTALQSVIDNADDDYLTGLARLRLARVQSEQGNHDAALATLDGDIASSLEAQRANIMGDVHHANGNDDQAAEAWRNAQALAEEQGQPLYGVALKLDDLGAEEATL
ncbi:YfgM family protein [Halomonas huangheensis]|uniref:Ancillary SecYEG translocon subunit n=1 Tax=Halomonas huangheensis TaxID=1178482 RepID=W1NBY9_9GAMM|nr:tetratricopeptide repeat protein [Halomonas huangheensis]ALM53669.1 hypothetical protein AR456_16360 [Halomonas huangheensis]ERL52425.1 hypothetical protein BJB45_10690 [Halomonas huangheensis]